MFTPPELYGKRFDQVLRTPNHDCFGLSILLFYLLFMGRYPFAGRFLGKGDMLIERAIPEFRFAYSSRIKETQMEPPPNGPILSDGPKNIAEAFETSFGPIGLRARPSAIDWIRLLESGEKEIVQCDKISGHHFFRSATSCPWCRMEQASPGFFAFAPPLFAATTSYINLEHLIAAIRTVSDPGTAPELSSLVPTVQGPPVQPSVSNPGIWSLRYLLGFIGSIIGVGMFHWGAQGEAFGGLIVAGSVIVGLQWSESPFRKALGEARNEWDELTHKWKHAANNTHSAGYARRHKSRSPTPSERRRATCHNARMGARHDPN